MKHFPNLLSEIKLGPITLNNRAVMSGHGMALGGGEIGISDRFHQYLLARAKGGAAMIGSESAPVHQSTVSRSLGIRLYTDEVISSLRYTANEIRREGSRLAITLWHGGHKDSFIRGSYALAPSPIPNKMGEVPKQITKSEIKELVKAYAEAALRCKKAELDAIEIQTSTDYLLGSFLSPVLNRRTDEYGGSFQNRVRFVVEILETIREKVGSNIAVGIRTSARHDIPGSPIDYGLEESIASMKLLSDNGLIDYVSVMTGSGWAPPSSSSIPHMSQPRIQLKEEGKKFKEAIRVPVIIAGRIRSPEEAENVISDGIADIVAMARTWIAEPDWIAKIKNDQCDQIRPCMSCNQACVGFVFRGLPGSCVINPTAGKESTMGEVERSPSPKRVAVIGGGPSGLEAARILALRGHQVTLFEKNNRLGGQLFLAANAPYRDEMIPALKWWIDEISRLQVKVLFNSKIELNSDLDYDEVIWAVGSSPGNTAIWKLRPYLFNGIEGTETLPSGRDILEQKIKVEGNVLIIDEEGGWPTISLVETLANDKLITKLTVVTSERSLGESSLTLSWEHASVLDRLNSINKLEIIPNKLVKKVEEDFVIFEDDSSLGSFSQFILNTGTVANSFPEDANAVGDCIAPRGLWASTNDAAKLARSI